MKQIRILLADDHNVIRRGLRLLLESHPEFTVVAEAADDKHRLTEQTDVAAQVDRQRGQVTRAAH